MDQQFVFTKNVGTLPHVHWFEMKKHGKGWRTVSYTAELCKVRCPLGKENVQLPLKNYETLSKIRKQFSDPFVCFVDGHLTAPSTFYQLVIDDITLEQKEVFIKFLSSNHEGLCCDYHVDIKWLDEMPVDMYKTLSMQ
jgi:hypothetical protein